MDKIHVIIPVYNAYDELYQCVESLIKYTDLNQHELIFVNDNSSDERIFEFLKKIDRENIKVLHNEENCGFSASVNKGILSCKGDVILLNSDTIVTKKWIEKMVECAYSDEAIATVTPLSNNATLCSIPNFCEENDIPSGYTVDEFAKLIERWSFKKYPIITVANGFCMYIKRSVIECIGLFDSETFSRGYGEENDFCFRAEQAGYRHVMCDNTFIYHKGTSSFLSEEKKQYIKNNAKILESRYKFQVAKNEQYCSFDKEEEVRNNISLALKLKNKKKNILYLVQADFREDASNNIGGTQFHVQDLMLGLKDNYNVFVASRDEDYLRLTVYINDERISYKFFIGNIPDYYTFTNRHQKELYKNILRGFSIDIVHIHHTLGLSLDLYYEAKKLNIPLFATLHDLFYICPTIKMINNKNELCVYRDNKKMCSECLKSTSNISETIDYIHIWRNKNSEALKLCDKIFVPSNSTKEIFSAYYSELSDKISVISHGVDSFEENQLKNIEKLKITDKCKYYVDYMFNKPSNNQLIEGWAYLEECDSKESQIFIHISDEKGKEEVLEANISARPDVAEIIKQEYLYCGFSLTIPKHMFNNGNLSIRIVVFNNGQLYSNGKVEMVPYDNYLEKTKFHVAFIGGMAYTKGSQLAYKMIKNSSKDIKWYVFGGIGDGDLDSIQQDNLIKTGWYDRKKLKSLIEINKIDLICILPIIPETFCYTLSEALMCKIPVLVTDIGALGDRVKEMDCGWLIKPNSDYREILKLVDYIKDTPDEYNDKLKIVSNLQVRSISDMITDYKQIYSEYNYAKIEDGNFNSKMIYDGYLLGNSKITCNSDNEQYFVNRIHQLEYELNSVYQSKSYKALIFIRGLNIPFKSQIKKIMIKCYKIIKHKNG